MGAYFSGIFLKIVAVFKLTVSKIFSILFRNQYDFELFTDELGRRIRGRYDGPKITDYDRHCKYIK